MDRARLDMVGTSSWMAPGVARRDTCTGPALESGRVGDNPYGEVSYPETWRQRLRIIQSLIHRRRKCSVSR